jgi:hypothetical protein
VIDSNSLVPQADIARTPTAKEVTTLERNLRVEDSVLRYELRIGMHGEATRWHLTAALRKVET